MWRQGEIISVDISCPFLVFGLYEAGKQEFCLPVVETNLGLVRT